MSIAVITGASSGIGYELAKQFGHAVLGEIHTPASVDVAVLSAWPILLCTRTRSPT